MPLKTSIKIGKMLTSGFLKSSISIYKNVRIKLIYFLCKKGKKSVGLAINLLCLRISGFTVSFFFLEKGLMF